LQLKILEITEVKEVPEEVTEAKAEVAAQAIQLQQFTMVLVAKAVLPLLVRLLEQTEMLLVQLELW
jgi:uncharacterized RDD family membrane protein YckC